MLYPKERAEEEDFWQLSYHLNGTCYHMPQMFWPVGWTDALENHKKPGKNNDEDLRWTL